MSKGVSMNMSLRKIGWVMNVSPLQSGYVTCEPDDQGLHLEWQAAVLTLPVSLPRHSLIAQALQMDECLPVGDPIDARVHLLESLRFGDGVLLPLRPEYERERATLARGRSLLAVCRVCSWLW